MLVILKGPPGSGRVRQGLRVAEDLSADLVLLQDSVYLARDSAIQGFKGRVYALEDDLKLRGIVPPEKAEPVGYGRLVDLMAEAEKVAGIF